MPLYAPGTNPPAAITFRPRATDGTPYTGLVAGLSLLVCKNATGAPAAAAGTATHLGSGLWSYVPTLGTSGSPGESWTDVRQLDLLWGSGTVQTSELNQAYEADYTPARAAALDQVPTTSAIAQNVWEYDITNIFDPEPAGGSLNIARESGFVNDQRLSQLMKCFGCRRISYSYIAGTNRIDVSGNDVFPTYPISPAVLPGAILRTASGYTWKILTATLVAGATYVVTITPLTVGTPASFSGLASNDEILIMSEVATTAPTAGAVSQAVWNYDTTTGTPTGSALATVVGLNTFYSRFMTMIEQIGSTSLWRFVTGALSLAPSGGGIGGTSAAVFFNLAGATSPGGSCGCGRPSSGCGGSGSGEARLYVGDTKARVFFLRDAGGAVVSLPAGLTVQVWDEDSSRGAATVTVTDAARWSGLLAFPSGLWAGSGALTPGNYWLRVLDGDGQIVTVQPLTVLDAGAAGGAW